MPAAPASAIANAPTPPVAPMPAELQSKPEDVSTIGGGVGTAARPGLCGGSAGMAEAEPVNIAAARKAAARVRVLRMALLAVGTANAIRCDDRAPRRSWGAHSHPFPAQPVAWTTRSDLRSAQEM
jgi:hypothetical protein